MKPFSFSDFNKYYNKFIWSHPDVEQSYWTKEMSYWDPDDRQEKQYVATLSTLRYKNDRIIQFYTNDESNRYRRMDAYQTFRDNAIELGLITPRAYNTTRNTYMDALYYKVNPPKYYNNNGTLKKGFWGILKRRVKSPQYKDSWVTTHMLNEGVKHLEINYSRHVYKCWACGETMGTHGPLGKLFDKFGTKKQKRLYNLIKPDELKQEDAKKVYLKLPEGYTEFKDSNPIFIPHKEAINYLKSRGVSEQQIEKYRIGYTVKGDFAHRIIIPSYNKEGVLNYFIARTWTKSKMKYKNPSVPKDEIIFNENLIDWSKDIFLVEGAFDSIFLDNSIPMLGKVLSNLLFDRLYNEAKSNIIICTDGDAWKDGLKIYHELNGGLLYDRIKIVKLPKDKDVCDLKGQINEFYFEIR